MARLNAAQPQGVAARPTASPEPRKRRGPFAWMRLHKVTATLLALLVIGASVGIAVVVFSEALTATPNTRTAPVIFAQGDDAASLDALDFIGASDPVISASGAAASFTVYGIPGATALSLGEVVELQNPDTTDNTAYSVVLSVSGAPAATLTAFEITFIDDIDGTVTWDLLGTPTLAAHTLDDAEIWEFTVSSLTMTAAASGSQGALTITATITQVV